MMFGFPKVVVVVVVVVVVRYVRIRAIPADEYLFKVCFCLWISVTTSRDLQIEYCFPKSHVEQLLQGEESVLYKRESKRGMYLST